VGDFFLIGNIFERGGGGCIILVESDAKNGILKFNELASEKMQSLDLKKNLKMVWKKLM
jgi:hypothetical protein